MKLYLDTSVISALFDDRNPERQLLTQDFFKSKTLTNCYISGLTIAEIDRTPDEALREKMKKAIVGLTIVPMPDKAGRLAEKYIGFGAVPVNFAEDALHIAIAVVNEMEFLLSWNFRHIVRRKTKDAVNMVNTLEGYTHIEIFTPAELL